MSLFSAVELAIVSARRNRLEERIEKGSRGAQTALDLTANPNRILSTVQISITLIGILSGVSAARCGIHQCRGITQ